MRTLLTAALVAASTGAFAQQIIVGQRFDILQAPACFTLEHAREVATYAIHNEGNSLAEFNRQMRAGTCAVISTVQYGEKTALIMEVVQDFPDNRTESGRRVIVEVRIFLPDETYATVYAIFPKEDVSLGVAI